MTRKTKERNHPKLPSCSTRNDDNNNNIISFNTKILYRAGLKNQWVSADCKTNQTARRSFCEITLCQNTNFIYKYEKYASHVLHHRSSKSFKEKNWKWINVTAEIFPLKKINTRRKQPKYTKKDWIIVPGSFVQY